MRFIVCLLETWMRFLTVTGIYRFFLSSREAFRSTQPSNEVVLWTSTVQIMQSGRETHNLPSFCTELVSAEPIPPFSHTSSMSEAKLTLLQQVCNVWISPPPNHVMCRPSIVSLLHIRDLVDWIVFLFHDALSSAYILLRQELSLIRATHLRVPSHNWSNTPIWKAARNRTLTQTGTSWTDQ
jgi:hypothetical protein